MKAKFCNSDIVVNSKISRSMQSFYNKDHRAKADRVIKLVKKALPVLSKLLDVPSDVSVRVASIKSKFYVGYYYNIRNLVVLDYKRDLRTTLEILCHELVHAEQYKTGRLSRVGRQQLWLGSAISRTKYMNLPWEQEAYGRQKELADLVIEQVPNILE